MIRSLKSSHLHQQNERGPNQFFANEMTDTPPAIVRTGWSAAYKSHVPMSYLPPPPKEPEKKEQAMTHATGRSFPQPLKTLKEIDRNIKSSLSPKKDRFDDLPTSPEPEIYLSISPKPPKTTSKKIPSMSRALVLLIGDSVTQQGLSTTHSGWGASLADYYSRFGDVINRGFSGYNSRWINEGYESLMLNDYSPSDSILSHKGVASDKYLCTLFLGANDASEDIGDGGKVGQGVGLEDYEKNINGILDKVAASIDASRGGVKPDRYNIVLITPGPCDHR